MLFIFLASCSKSADNVLPDEDIRLNFSLVGITGGRTETEMVTKAEEYQTEAEKNINLLTLAVYDNDGVLEWTRDYTGPKSANYTITGLVAGPKTIVAIANRKVTVPKSLEDVYSTVSSLAENSRESFVMFGTGKAVADYDSETAVIRISRLAAKFRLHGSIITRWEVDEPEQFDILGIYVANAGGNVDFAGNDRGPNYNLRTVESCSDNPAVKDLTVASKIRWSNGGAFNGGTDLYAYPNSDVKNRTAVLIKASFDNRICYYPIVIDQSVTGNTLYNFGDIVISCEGAPNPWSDFEKVRIDYSIEISDWVYSQLSPEYVF